MKNAFRLSTNSRNQSRVLKLRMTHGPAGYGVYIMLLELMHAEPDGKLPLDYELLVYDLRADRELIRSVIEDFGLFESAVEEDRLPDERTVEIDHSIYRTLGNEAYVNDLAAKTDRRPDEVSKLLAREFRRYALASGLKIPNYSALEENFIRFSGSESADLQEFVGLQREAPAGVGEEVVNRRLGALAG